MTQATNMNSDEKYRDSICEEGNFQDIAVRKHI